MSWERNEWVGEPNPYEELRVCVALLIVELLGSVDIRVKCVSNRRGEVSSPHELGT